MGHDGKGENGEATRRNPGASPCTGERLLKMILRDGRPVELPQNAEKESGWLGGCREEGKACLYRRKHFK